MKKLLLIGLAAPLIFSAGCSGISRVSYNRCDRQRKMVRVAVIAYNWTKTDREKMWDKITNRPRAAYIDTFPEEIAESLSGKTDYQVLPPEVVQQALKKLGLQGKDILTLSEIRAVRRLTGADAILFANVTFYLQNYLFYNTFGLVEISMRMVGTSDGRLLWDAKGRNFALFISTDRALVKLRDKMLAQLAQKLEQDKLVVLQAGGRPGVARID